MTILETHAYKKPETTTTKNLQENSDKIIHNKGYDDETQLLARLKKNAGKETGNFRPNNFKTQIRSTRHLQSIF